ncbi:hypothetical protein EDM55_11280 [Brevibacillus centrosporus]|nr:hypothetical protein EDM55_11280 [Brevibacillus centrosporus]
MGTIAYESTDRLKRKKGAKSSLVFCNSVGKWVFFQYSTWTHWFYFFLVRRMGFKMYVADNRLKSFCSSLFFKFDIIRILASSLSNSKV